MDRLFASRAVAWLFFGLLAAWQFAAGVTHVNACIRTASWEFLTVGLGLFPIAVVHGTGVWLGAW